MLNLRQSLCAMVLFSLACKQPAAPTSAQAPATPAATPPASGAATATAEAPVDPAAEVIVVGSHHDTLSAARAGLEAALKQPVDLPLPYPRVERHADVFRVVLGRGRGAAMAPLITALRAAGQAPEVAPAGQAGGDDVIRLGIVCTDGTPAPMYAAPLAKDSARRELALIPSGQVVIPREDEESAEPDDEAGRGGGHAGSSGPDSGYLTVLQPRAGVLPSPLLLLPADCTPRDEDNDDGNGRLLSGGRLCLTTRPSGRQGQVPHADLLAVTPNYRRCVRFPEAGTFDGFDHDPGRTQFAVEAALPTAPPTAGTAAPAAAAKPGADKGPRPPAASGLLIYDVSPRGELTLRGQLPGLQRPAYLGDHLVAVSEPPPGSAADKTPGLVAVDGLARPAAPGTALPAPRRIFSFAPGTYQRLLPKVPLYRPAAPTLQDGRVRASFQQACRPDGEKRVRAEAKAGFVQCLLEVEVEVGLDGARPQQRCRLDNAQNNLEEPLTTPCPS